MAFLRPWISRIAKLGSLHEFMTRWPLYLGTFWVIKRRLRGKLDIVIVDSLIDHKWLHWFTFLPASYWPVPTLRSHSLVKNTNNSSNQPFIKPPGLELAIFCRCWKWKPALDQFDHHDISSLWWTQYFTNLPSNKDISTRHFCENVKTKHILNYNWLCPSVCVSVHHIIILVAYFTF